MNFFFIFLLFYFIFIFIFLFLFYFFRPTASYITEKILKFLRSEKENVMREKCKNKILNENNCNSISNEKNLLIVKPLLSDYQFISKQMKMIQSSDGPFIILNGGNLFNAIGLKKKILCKKFEKNNFGCDSIEIVKNEIWSCSKLENTIKIWNFDSKKVNKVIKTFKITKTAKFIFSLYENEEKKFVNCKIVSRVLIINTDNSINICKPYKIVSNSFLFPLYLGFVVSCFVCEFNVLQKFKFFFLGCSKGIVKSQWQRKKDKTSISKIWETSIFILSFIF